MYKYLKKLVAKDKYYLCEILYNIKELIKI